jgi:hypothetical protein
MPISELLDFTRRALENHISREDINRALAEAGWGSAEINNALGAFADIEFPLAIPKPKPYISAQEAFLYLILFVSLYSCVWNVITLLFEFINRGFPDEIINMGRAYTDDRIRWHVAALIVTFPLFLFTYRVVSRRIARDPIKRESRPRKWLTYLTLFVAAFALVGDFVTLIYTLLGGDQTLRFILKTATVALIAGGVFLFFFNDIRKGEGE